MLHLVQSNKMENLASQLVSRLKHGFANKASVLQQDTVLVQSPGMAQWLKLVIAQQIGITVNIEFPLPSSFIWRLYQQHVRDLPEESAFTKSNMTWKLMHLLPSLMHNPAFAEVGKYLRDDNPLKCYQLCVKIADVFDQYLVYRPEWLLSWEQGEDDLPDVDWHAQPWQPALWRALVSYTAELDESPYHRANLHSALLAKLSDDSVTDGPIMVFGMSAMPQQQLEVLQAISQHNEVVIFWLNPSFHYWGDVVEDKIRTQKRLASGTPEADFLDVGNPLLSSWGKLGKDYQDLLLDLEPVTEDDFDQRGANSLLGAIQQEILALTFRGTHDELPAEELLSNGQQYPKLTVSAEDRSLQVQVCHSKVRELEVLKDALLRRFENDSELQPGDIVVMMPDVASYAPLIDGVFGTATQDKFIPYTISDRSMAEESGILPSFLTLMTLHQSRLGLSDILSVFTVPAVLEKFDVSMREAEWVKQWLSESGIRWGWQEADKSRWNLPAEQQNTWLFGLRRLLAGYAMGADQLLIQGDNHIAPYADIEGQQAAALGKFYQFFKVIEQTISFTQQQALIESKMQGGLALLNQLYAENEETLRDIVKIRQAIEGFSTHQAQYPQPITQDIFVAELQQRLSEKGVGQRFLAGYVNFCTLMPMRSIPFKQVCILGLNDGDYPRQTVPVGFDLMRTSKVRKGDRSRRFDDRYLFLEALLSARECLYLSYTGYSQKDNSERSPSVLVSELLEYCTQTFCLQGQDKLAAEDTEKRLLAQIIHHYPLQPFSPAHFVSADMPTQSYDEQWYEVAQQHRQVPKEPELSPAPLPALFEQDEVREIELEDLIQFFMNPAKAFFAARWHTSLGFGQVELSDAEPFELDALAHFKFSQAWLDGNTHHALLRAQGELAQANVGVLQLEKLTEQNLKLVDALTALRGEAAAAYREVNFTYSNLRVHGTVKGIYGQKLIDCRAGKIRAKDKIALWLRWLMLNLVNVEDRCESAHFLGTDGCFVLQAIDPEEAKQQLETFLDYWARGQNQLLFCFPESAWTWLKSVDPDKTLAQFVGNDFAIGEGQEPHIARFCPDLSVYFESFRRQSETLYTALFEAGRDE